MPDGAPEGMKRAITQRDETWNPDVPQNPVYISRSLGWNYTFDQRMELWKLQEQETARDWQLDIAALPEPERSRRLRQLVNESDARQALLSETDRRKTIPTSERYNPLSWDILGTGMYWSGARLTEIKERKMPFTRSYTEKLEPGYVLFPATPPPPTEFQIEWEQQVSEMQKTGKLPPIKESADYTNVWRFASNVAYDPVSWITSGAGKAVSFIGSNGQKIHLTEKGVEALRRANIVTKVTNSIGEVRYYLNPETRHTLTKILRDPAQAKLYVAKEGLKFLGREIVPKQFLPWTYIPAFISTAQKGVQSGLSPVFSAIQRHTRNIINKPSISVPVEYTALKIGYEGNLANARKAISKQIDDLTVEAQKAIQGKYPNFRAVLTEYIENPEVRRHYPELEQFRERFEQLHQQRAAIEKSYGILFSSRMNYVRHYLTSQAKIYLGKLGKAKPMEMPAPFSIQRKIQGTINDINKDYIEKYGVKLFNDDAFFLLQKRLYESETAVQTVQFLNKIKENFGRTARGMEKGYVRSSIPQLKGIYLPKEIELALKNDKDVQTLLKSMDIKTTKEMVFQVATMPLKGAYSVNKFTVGVFQRLVTRYFPAFYFQNLFGGKFMAYVFGETWGMEKETIDIMRGKKVIINSKNGMQYSTEDIRKIVRESGINKQLPQGIESNQIEEWLSKYGRLEEEQIRTQMLLNRLKEGDMPVDAVAYVNKFQFDYTKELNQYETFMSTVIPFWRWQSNIVPLMAELAVTQSGKIATWAKLMQSSWMSPEAQVLAQGPFMPAYTAGKFLYYLGGNRSEMINIGTPIESATTLPYRLITQPTTLLSPIPQIMYEEAVGKEMWNGEPITDQPLYLARKLGFGRMMDFWAKFTNPNIPWWEKGVELGTGFNIMQGTSLISQSGVIPENSERIVNNAIRRLGGNWHGCGY